MKAAYTVDCAVQTGDAPHLCHGVMGGSGYNLLRTGVKLQRTLGGICEEPLLRRVADTMGTGIGIDGACGIYAEDAQGNPRYDFTFFDQVVDVITGPRSIPFLGVGFMPETLSVAFDDPAGRDRLPPEAEAKDLDYREAQPVALSLRNLPPGRWKVSHSRVDHEHSNAYTAWLAMKRPIVPTDAELAVLKARMGLELAEPEFFVDVEKGTACLETVLPPHAVSLWCLEPAR